MPGPSLPHAETIEAVLRAFPAGMETARAIVVLEDVAVALYLGLQYGLSVDQIADKHAELVAEIRDGWRA